LVGTTSRPGAKLGLGMLEQDGRGGSQGVNALLEGGGLYPRTREVPGRDKWQDCRAVLSNVRCPCHKRRRVQAKDGINRHRRLPVSQVGKEPGQSNLLQAEEIVEELERQSRSPGIVGDVQQVLQFEHWVIPADARRGRG